MKNKIAVLTDFEQSCVSAAVTDVHHNMHGLDWYLREVLAREPTEQEVYDLRLDAQIAIHVEGILRSMIMKGESSFTGEQVEDIPGRVAHLDQLIEHARRFNEFSIALRGEAAVAKEVLDGMLKPEDGWMCYPPDWVDGMETIMTPVIGPKATKAEGAGPTCQQIECSDPACDYNFVCDSHQVVANSKLKTFVPQAVAILQKTGMWEGATPENVKCRMAFARTFVAVLSLPDSSGKDDVIMKCGEKHDAATLEAHHILGEAGLAPALLGSGIADDGTPFTLEVMGAGLRPCTGDWGDESLFEDSAQLTAKLHQVQTTWYDKHRAVIQEKVPVMKDEPPNSAMWVMVRPDMMAKHSQEHFLPPTDKLRLLLAAIPRPSGQYAERLATVHGDLHHQNIVCMLDGHSVVVDIEGVCVSSAVQDLVHTCERDLVAFYLKSMSGQEPSDEEIDTLWLEAKIAEHVHFYLLREIFWYKKGEWAPEQVATHMDKYIQHATRFSCFVEKLRGDAVLAKEVLAEDWRDECEMVRRMDKYGF